MLNTTHKPQTTAVARPSRPPTESDSDSDYGSRSKKKKRVRAGDEIRVSTRGVKIPNYVDDVEDFEAFEADTHPGYYYTETVAQYPQEDEIEQVLSHTRDEGKEPDPEDKFYENIVGSLCNFLHSTLNFFHSASTSNGRIFPIYTIRTRRMNS
jgi:chromodomain-helicase-DNA-binding protein 1